MAVVKSSPSPLMPLLLLSFVVVAMIGPWFIEHEDLIFGAMRGLSSVAGLIPLLLLFAILFLTPSSPPTRQRQPPTGPSFYDAGTSQYGLFLLLLLLVVLASMTSSWQSGWHSSVRT